MLNRRVKKDEEIKRNEMKIAATSNLFHAVSEITTFMRSCSNPRAHHSLYNSKSLMLKKDQEYDNDVAIDEYDDMVSYLMKSNKAMMLMRFKWYLLRLRLGYHIWMIEGDFDGKENLEFGLLKLTWPIEEQSMNSIRE